MKMSTQAARLRCVRRELDEIGESVERLAREVERVRSPSRTITPLVSMIEIAEITGIAHSTLRTMRMRGQLPVPVAELAIGPVWLRKDIVQWLRKRNGAS